MILNQSTRIWRLAAQFFFGCFALTLLTLVCFELGFNVATTAFVYLIAIVSLSLFGSFISSAVLSLIAVLCLRYFFAVPIFDFRDDLPEDVAVATAFLLTSLIVTGLVRRFRSQTEAALRAEGKAREAEHELRLAIDTIPALVWTALPDGSLDFINRRWGELGLSLEDLRGSEWTAVIHPDERERVSNGWRTAVQNGTPYENIERVRLAGGEYRWVLSRAMPLRNELGKIVKWYGTDTDIEGRMRAEEQMREQARLLDLTHDAIFVRDMHDVITYWNRGAAEFYGWTAEEVVGKITTHDLLKTVFPKPLDEIAAELRRTRRWEGEIMHTKADGTHAVVASRWSLQCDGHDQPVAILELNNDVTERKRAEQDLHKAQAELAHVTRVTTLGQLTASIAHEVNQPLAGVVSNAEACRRWLANEPPNLNEARNSVEWIINDGNRASEVIRRVRALAKADTQKAPLDINEVVNEVITLLQRELFNHRVALRLELASGLPSVIADRVQLQQVIINLVMNGMEAMQPVADRQRELVIRSHQDETRQLVLSVKDCGVGISPKSASQLFDPFFTTKSSGMGMGLSICRSIIGAHGGRMSAVNNAGSGATFQFTLPAHQESIMS